MLRAEAMKYKVPFIYCNLVGGNDELIFDGQSLVFDATGNLLAEGTAFREDLIIVDLDAPLSAVASAKAERSTLHAPLAPATSLHDALVLGLRDYVRKCNF